MVRYAGSYMLQIITTQLLTAEQGASTDTAVLFSICLPENPAVHLNQHQYSFQQQEHV